MSARIEGRAKVAQRPCQSQVRETTSCRANEAPPLTYDGHGPQELLAHDAGQQADARQPGHDDVREHEVEAGGRTGEEDVPRLEAVGRGSDCGERNEMGRNEVGRQRQRAGVT